jgi:hypothetical protein
VDIAPRRSEGKYLGESTASGWHHGGVHGTNHGSERVTSIESAARSGLQMHRRQQGPLGQRAFVLVPRKRSDAAEHDVDALPSCPLETLPWESIHVLGRMDRAQTKRGHPSWGRPTQRRPPSVWGRPSRSANRAERLGCVSSAIQVLARLEDADGQQSVCETP